MLLKLTQHKRFFCEEVLSFYLLSFFNALQRNLANQNDLCFQSNARVYHHLNEKIEYYTAARAGRYGQKKLRNKISDLYLFQV